MLRGREPAGDGEPFVITVSSTALTETSFDLAEGSNLGSVTMTIHGAGFTSESVVRLVSPIETRDAAVNEFRDRNTLVATFDLANLPPGKFTVRVVNPSSAADAASPFLVNDSQNVGRLALSISTPPACESDARSLQRSHARTSGKPTTLAVI